MSIEERAIEWATNKPQSHGRLQGYIKGATEQKQIDIERACRILDLCGFTENQLILFRKAMGE